VTTQTHSNNTPNGSPKEIVQNKFTLVASRQLLYYTNRKNLTL